MGKDGKETYYENSGEDSVNFDDGQLKPVVVRLARRIAIESESKSSQSRDYPSRSACSRQRECVVAKSDVLIRLHYGPPRKAPHLSAQAIQWT
jgi:hypothetical protein